jgi:CRISPR-associated protein Cas2
MFCLVCFDNVDDRIRYRAVKILESYGVRVQKSVFECPSITEEQFLKMQTRIEACIDSLEVSVRDYFFCRHCVSRVEFPGLGEKPGGLSYQLI